MGRVAAVMVVRDEAPLVERALRSVRDHVDELVVLDLGSRDGADDRALACGARVVPGQWSADAAAVRNAALEAADADWNLVLDAAEWLDAGAQSLARLVAGPPERVGLVEVVRGPGGPGEERHPIALSPRLLPRGVRYTGAIHDEVTSDLPTVQTDIVLAGDDAPSARWRTDRALTEAALLQSLAVRPDDPALLHQLASEMRTEGRAAEACDVYLAAIGITPAAAPWRHALITEALATLTAAGRFREAVALTDAEMATWHHSPDFTFLLGDLFFELLLATPALVDELAPLIATSWRRCLELGDRPDLAGSVHGRGSFLAAQNLYVLALTLGDEKEAQHWADRAGELRAMSIASSGRPRLLG